MTKYLQERFSVGVGGEAYARGWEETFGRKPRETVTVVTFELRPVAILSSPCFVCKGFHADGEMMIGDLRLGVHFDCVREHVSYPAP